MKKIHSLLAVLLLALSLTACAKTAATDTDAADTVTSDSAVSEATDTDTDSQTSQAADHYPVTITDQAGREVTLEEEPQRLVSGYYISTSALIALDLDEKLVGIEAKADKRPIYQLSAPDLLQLPNVGTAKEFDLEGCAALEPDLVILPKKLSDAADTLEGLGIKVLLVNPENQQLLTEMISLIAAATNTQEKADALLDFTSSIESRLADTLSQVSAPYVYLAGNSSLLSTAGDSMYQSSMIQLAGGTNVAGEITDSYWVEISYEQLLSWNPEYIILASDADYTVEDVLSDPNLADCTAVIKQKVYQIPGNAEAWDSPVPSGILGSLWLSNILHPELMTADECTALMDEYYETFYHFTYSEN